MNRYEINKIEIAISFRNIKKTHYPELLSAYHNVFTSVLGYMLLKQKTLFKINPENVLLIFLSLYNL